MPSCGDPDGDALFASRAHDLAHALERNGYLQAAEDLRSGMSVEQATAYAAGQSPRYNDLEGMQLQKYIDALHGA